VLFQFVTSPVRVAVVSLLVMELVRVQAGAAPAYDLRVAYAIYTPNLVLNASSRRRFLQGPNWILAHR
jgi:hypothetical protein